MIGINTGGRQLRKSRAMIAVAAATGAVLATVPKASADINGFSGWTLNKGGTYANVGYQASNTVFTVTDGNNGEQVSGWSPNVQSIGNGFLATYNYVTVPQYGYPTYGESYQADGSTLAFQSPVTGSTSALGAGSGSLGYAGTTPGFPSVPSQSAAIGYDLFDNNVNYPGGSELLTGGNQGGVNDLGGGVDLSTADTFVVRVASYGNTLIQTTIDTTTGTAASQAYYTLNMANQLGATTAIVGITGATGGLNSTQNISNFSFVSNLKYSPIAVTGFNYNGIISKANGASLITATMDGGKDLGGFTFYEKGVNPNNANEGLPASGSTFQSQADSSHTFQMQNYSNNNVISLSSDQTSGTLTLTNPAAYSALSFLTSTGGGPGVFTATIDYLNGSTSTQQFMESPDWFYNGPSAWVAGGRETTDGFFDEDGSNPNLYAEDLTLTDSTDPISSIVFNYKSGSSIMIFGVSGQQFVPILTYTGIVTPGLFDTSTSNFTYNGSSTTFANGDRVLFDDSAANTSANRTINVSSGITSGGLVFNNSTSTLPYTFTGAGIGGSGGITLNGNGTVILNNPNTFTGDTLVNAGTLVVGTGGMLNSSNITISTGAGLNVSGGTLTNSVINLTNYGTVSYGGTSLSIANLNGSGGFSSSNASGTNLTLTGGGSYSGQINLNGGMLTVNNSGQSVALTGSNTFAGIILQAGTLQASSSGLGSSTINASGGALGSAAGNLSVGNQIVGAALGINSVANGTVELTNSGNTLTGPITVSAGTLQIDSPGTLGATTVINVSSGASFLVNDSSGNAGLGVTLNITGPGVTSNNGTPLLDGPEGALRGADNNVLSVWAGNINVSGTAYISAGSDAELNLNGAITGTGSVVFTAQANQGSGALVMLQPPTSTATTYTGETQILPGPQVNAGQQVQLGNTNGFSPNSGLNFLTGSAPQQVVVDLAGFNQTFTYLTGGAQAGYALTSSGGPSTLTVTSGLKSGSPAVMTTAITGNIALVMNDPTGSGEQILSGANTYSGGTTIIKGTLAAASSGAFGSNPVTLKGGTLGLAAVVAPGTPSVTSSNFSSFTLNTGGAAASPSVSGNTLQITTNGTNGQANSAFYPTKVPVSDALGFTATFNYNLSTGQPADGIAFVLQNDPRGASAVAPDGGQELGYAGTNQITNSAAVMFEAYGGPKTTFSSNGSDPVYTAASSTAPVYFGVGAAGFLYNQPVDVKLVYNGLAQTLTETLFGDTSLTSFTTTYTGIDYEALVGGTSAYVGFTGGTGGLSCTQIISNFSYETNITTPQSISNPVIAATANTTSAIQIGLAPTGVNTTSEASVGPINISSGAIVDVTVSSTAGGVHGLLATPSLAIDSTSGSFNGTLDLGANGLDIAAGGNTLSQITAMIAGGYHNGAWNGSGIASSAAASDSRHLTALGVLVNDNGGTPLYGSGGSIAPTFDGGVPADGDILVKYTYYGDANLDGSVNSTDYTSIDAGFLAHGTLTGWQNGDFNYDGVINGSDYTLIDNAFNMQGASLSSEIASPTAQVAGTSAVPEPASLGLIGLGTLAMLGRRRKR